MTEKSPTCQAIGITRINLSGEVSARLAGTNRQLTSPELASITLSDYSVQEVGLALRTPHYLPIPPGNLIKPFGDLKFYRYTSSPHYMRLLNTGKTLMIDLGTPPLRRPGEPSGNGSRCEGARDYLKEDSTWPRISGGGLKGSYLFHQIHFHWASYDSAGSEHSKSCKH